MSAKGRRVEPVAVICWWIKTGRWARDGDHGDGRFADGYGEKPPDGVEGWVDFLSDGGLLNQIDGVMRAAAIEHVGGKAAAFIQMVLDGPDDRVRVVSDAMMKIIATNWKLIPGTWFATWWSVRWGDFAGYARWRAGVGLLRPVVRVGHRDVMPMVADGVDWLICASKIMQQPVLDNWPDNWAKPIFVKPDDERFVRAVEADSDIEGFVNDAA